MDGEPLTIIPTHPSTHPLHYPNSLPPFHHCTQPSHAQSTGSPKIKSLSRDTAVVCAKWTLGWHCSMSKVVARSSCCCAVRSSRSIVCPLRAKPSKNALGTSNVKTTDQCVPRPHTVAFDASSISCRVALQRRMTHAPLACGLMKGMVGTLSSEKFVGSSPARVWPLAMGSSTEKRQRWKCQVALLRVVASVPFICVLVPDSRSSDFNLSSRSRGSNC